MRKLSKLVLNESDLQNTSHLKDFNMNRKLSTQQPKFTNPFARLDFRKKRKKTTKVKVVCNISLTGCILLFTRSLILPLILSISLLLQIISPWTYDSVKELPSTPDQSVEHLESYQCTKSSIYSPHNTHPSTL